MATKKQPEASSQDDKQTGAKKSARTSAKRTTGTRKTSSEQVKDTKKSGSGNGDDTPQKNPRKTTKTEAEKNLDKPKKNSSKAGASEAKSTRKTNAARSQNKKGTVVDLSVPADSVKEVAVKRQTPSAVAPAAALLFQAPDFSALTPAGQAKDKPQEQSAPAKEGEGSSSRRRRTRSGKDGQAKEKTAAADSQNEEFNNKESNKGKKDAKTDGRNRKNAKKSADKSEDTSSKNTEDAAASDASSHRRRRRRSRPGSDVMDEVTALKGSTRLEAKRQRRKEGRKESRRRHSLSESEFLARRESVDRKMLVRQKDGLNQIAVLEDNMLVEHYVARHTQTTIVGSVFLGRVQNVLPSMEAAFVDIGRGRNAVLYAGEVNWDAAGMKGKPRKIEDALKTGDPVLVQATKDPIGHKGARLTSQITLAGRFLVLVPGGTMTGISRKLPEPERARLKRLLKELVPAGHGVIVRTAAEGASKEQLEKDIQRLVGQWQKIQKDSEAKAKKAPVLLHGEPELALRVVRDIFNEDFSELLVAGKESWQSVSDYVKELSPDLLDRVHHWTSKEDLFAAHRVDEQLTKGMDRKVWLPSGGSLVIDRTEAMTVIDVNTGRFTGEGGTLEETVTRNNLEAAEEIVRQLRLRDIGGIIVVDFVDMVLESNRDLVLRRLVECLGRDRTRHQVTEITSLGLVQMTRKRVGQGLVEAFSTPCEHCEGRGFIVHDTPVEKGETTASKQKEAAQSHAKEKSAAENSENVVVPTDEATRKTLAGIAAAAASKHQQNEAEGDSRKSASRKRSRRRAASSGPVTTGEQQDSSVIVVN